MTMLVGREQEQQDIAAFLSEGIEGGAALLIVGDAGIGKTALLDAAANQARTLGLTVLRCAGVEFESRMSFAALNQLLLDVGPESEPALAVCLGLDDGPQPSIPEIAEALLSVLKKASPGLLVVDDLPWVDRMSTEVLAAVVRRLPDSGFRLIAAQRTGEGGPLAFDRRLRVHVLDGETSARLLTLRRPDLSYAARRKVLSEAHGNPLALSLLPAHGGTSSWTPLTSQLVNALREEVAELPAAAQDLLLLVALDSSTSVASPLSDSERLAVEPAMQAGLVRVGAEGADVRFSHPLTRLAVLENSTGAARQRAQAALAARHHADPIRRAWHLAEATVDPDDAVAAEIEHAGRLLLGRGDVVGSVNLVSRAAELSSTEQARADRLMHAAYIGMELAGRLDAAAQTVRETGAVESLRAAITAAQVLYNEGGSVLAAHRLLAGALEVNPGAPAQDVEDALHALLLTCWSAARTDLWTAVDAHVPAGSEVLGATIAVLKNPLATAAAALPRLDALIDDLGPRSRDPQHILRLGKAAVYVDRVPLARAALERVVEDGRRGGAISAAIHALISLTADDWLTGEWDRVDRSSAEIIELSGQYGYARYASPANFTRAVVAANRGEPIDELTETLRSAGARDAGIGQIQIHHVDGLAALARGDYQRAYGELSAIVLPGSLPWASPHVMWVLLDVAEAAARSGRQAEAKAHATALRGTDVAAVSARLALHVAAATALAADPADADALFEQALAIPFADHYRFDFARVQLLHGERLRRNRQAVRARQQLAVAAETFRSVGAPPWTARAEAELQATGGHRQSSKTTGTRLTGQETEIAMLAATGLTNKEIAARLLLSPRTVGSHLNGVFRKLGISTRAALRDALAETSR